MVDATATSVSFATSSTPLPPSVLRGIREGVTDWNGTGISILEIGQRTPEFKALVTRVVQRIRELLAVPGSHAVLLLPGGGSHQFAMVPLNLLRGHSRAAYLCRGHWSRAAAAEARRWCEVVDEADPAVAYLHYTSNETIEGMAFEDVPDAGVPIVADWSSLLFAAPIDVSRFDLVYAGAQKSLGAAGLTVVLIRESLIGRALPVTPSVLDYGTHLAAGSMLGTSVPMAWLAADLMLDWMVGQGGVAGLAEAVEQKARLVYAALDSCPVYVTSVPPEHRSPTVITFGLTDPALESRFVALGGERGLHGLEGHTSVGGLRVALYPGLAPEAAERLAEFLIDFNATDGR